MPDLMKDFANDTSIGELLVLLPLIIMTLLIIGELILFVFATSEMVLFTIISFFPRILQCLFKADYSDSSAQEKYSSFLRSRAEYWLKVGSPIYSLFKIIGNVIKYGIHRQLESDTHSQSKSDFKLPSGTVKVPPPSKGKKLKDAEFEGTVDDNSTQRKDAKY